LCIPKTSFQKNKSSNLQDSQKSPTKGAYMGKICGHRKPPTSRSNKASGIRLVRGPLGLAAPEAWSSCSENFVGKTT